MTFCVAMKIEDGIVAIADSRITSGTEHVITSYSIHYTKLYEGIAEANMTGTAAGLTIGGKIPFAGTFAGFATGRVYDQIRQSVAYSNKNVKIS